MYESPSIEMLGDSQMNNVMGAFVWAIGPVFVAVAAVVLLILSVIDITP
ncbi:MAG: hypothetical protein JW881_02805 [Spirochaetales bacterium]|nr:hypothetical protein [Spirochaetales bacterium]